MNGVIGMSELLLDTRLDRTQRDYTETIRASAGGLLTIINDILDFSKIEAGKVDLEQIDMDLCAIVDDVAHLLSVQAQAKKLELITNIDPLLPAYVTGDPGRLRQILLNLGANAIKFTANGEISISVRLAGSDAQGCMIRCKVSDTGIGIPAHRVGALFLPFSQIDASTTRHFGGTGLGLSIVRRLVELMQGEAGVDSREGAGSTFWFTARFGKSARQRATPRLDLELPSARRALSGQWHGSTQSIVLAAPKANSPITGHVLLADDNRVNQKVALGALQRLGLPRWMSQITAKRRWRLGRPGYSI